MGRFLRLNRKAAVVTYVLSDLICVGMGMGVPFFCILLGFPTGWYLARRATIEEAGLEESLRNVLTNAIFSSAITLLLMAAMWGAVVPKAFDATYDFENFGIPMILFDPRASFVGWLILMILVSPFLQLLTTVFAAFVTLLVGARSRGSRP